MKKKILIFFFLFCLPQIASATNLKKYCNSAINQIANKNINNLKIENITVNVDKNKKWTKNSLKILIGNFRWIPRKYKKRYDADISVVFENNLFCNFRGSIRNNGNQKDHIALKNNSIIQSIDVHLKNGHIYGITKFKLLRPNTRGNYKDEVLLTEILREFNYLAPRTNFINAKINGVKSKMLFQEKPDKSMLSYNSRTNGPLFEGDERFMFRLVKNIPDNQLSNLSLGMLPLLEKGVDTMLSRQINSEWNHENVKNFNIAHNSLTKLNASYLLYTNKYKNKKDGPTFSNYGLSNNLLGLGNKKNILKLDVYNLTVFATNGWHGLGVNNRKFFWNSKERYFEPINSDTNANIEAETTVLSLPYSDQFDAAFDVLEEMLRSLDIKKLSNEMSFRGIILNEKQTKKKINKIKKNLNKLKKIYLESDQEIVKYNRASLEQEKMWDNYYKAMNVLDPSIYVVIKSKKLGLFQRCTTKPFVCEDFKFSKEHLNSLIEGRLAIKNIEYQYLGVM